MIFAVIDTNVIVAAMMSKHSDSATVKVINAVREGRLKPVLAPDIVAEYGEVLSRSKFQFVEEDVRQTIDAIVANAVFLEPKSSGETFADESDGERKQSRSHWRGAVAVTPTQEVGGSCGHRQGALRQAIGIAKEGLVECRGNKLRGNEGQWRVGGG